MTTERLPKKGDPKVEALKAAGMSATEIADFQEFQLGKERKAKMTASKKMATDMISEGGKYHQQYKKLDDQCEAIWQKALAEGRKSVGLPEVDVTIEKSK